MRKDIILYEDAVKIARQRNKNYNMCQEFNNAFLIYEEKEEETAGGDCGIVVMKKGGSLELPFTYLLSAKGIKEIGEPKRIED